MAGPSCFRNGCWISFMHILSPEEDAKDSHAFSIHIRLNVGFSCFLLCVLRCCLCGEEEIAPLWPIGREFEHAFPFECENEMFRTWWWVLCQALRGQFTSHQCECDRKCWWVPEKCLRNKNAQTHSHHLRYVVCIIFVSILFFHSPSTLCRSTSCNLHTVIFVTWNSEKNAIW